MDNVSKLYEELISFSDLYDSASFEAKKMIVNQLIRRVDVYRGYQLNITFNFDLTPYIEGDDTAACWKNGRKTFLFENGVKSNVGGCIGTACKSLKNGAGEAMQPPKFGFGKKKSTILPTKYSAFLVENSGIEPLTSCMPCKRSPEPRTHAPPRKGARMNDI